MQALGFDLGDTLVEYAGVPLNWEARYPEALERLGQAAGRPFSPAQLERCAAVLRRFNTRLQPRETEVAFADILAALWQAAGAAPGTADEARDAEAFFAVFRQRLRTFPDTIEALNRLRVGGRRVGVFTDVPYGMPRALVLADLGQSGLSGLVDAVVTSRDAGFRKPSPRALAALADALGCGPGDLAYVGNERKDVDAARAFGCEAILLDRSGANPAWGQHRTIRSLAEL